MLKVLLSGSGGQRGIWGGIPSINDWDKILLCFPCTHPFEKNLLYIFKEKNWNWVGSQFGLFSVFPKWKHARRRFSCLARCGGKSVQLEGCCRRCRCWLLWNWEGGHGHCENILKWHRKPKVSTWEDEKKCLIKGASFCSTMCSAVPLPRGEFVLTTSCIVSAA